MLNPTPLEEFFSRLGATSDSARELATCWGDIESFLAADFETRLEAVVSSRKAAIIANEYDDFEHMRDIGSCRRFRSFDGIGGKTAMQVDYAYIRRTVSIPRDVLTARQLAAKMNLSEDDRDTGLDRTGAEQPQANLERWVNV